MLYMEHSVFNVETFLLYSVSVLTFSSKLNKMSVYLFGYISIITRSVSFSKNSATTL